jgi:hypothetical protein
MRLEKKERLVAVDLARREADLLVVAENGFAKRVPLSQFPTQGRNGRGLRVYKSGVALAGGCVGGEEDHAFFHMTRGGARSVKFSAVPRRSRAANGTRLVDTGAKDRVQLVGLAVARPIVQAAPPKKAAKSKKSKVKATAKGKPRKPEITRGKARRQSTKKKTTGKPTSRAKPAKRAGKKAQTKKKAAPKRK